MQGKMGDRARVGRDKDYDDKLAKLRKRQVKAQEAKQNKKRKQDISSVLGTEDFDSKFLTVFQGSYDYEGSYRPKTKETRVIYEKILNIVQLSLGDQPQNIIRDAADEVIAILKNEHMRAPEKKRDVEKLLGSISDPKFGELTDLGKKITDYSEEADTGVARDEGVDEELGVAVVFDVEDSEDESDYEVREVRQI